MNSQLSTHRTRGVGRLCQLTALAVWIFATALLAEDDKSTLTKVGQVAPDFKVTTLGGKDFSLHAYRGKVVLVNFFATWCGPCMQEMPHLEKEIWQKFKDQGLVVIALGREHENSELAKFQKEKGFTFLMAGDPKRGAYAKFAEQYIPRNYLISKEGKISYQSVGYNDEDLKALVAAIEKETGKKGH